MHREDVMIFFPDDILIIMGIVLGLCILDKIIHKEKGLLCYTGVILLGLFMSVVYNLTGITPFSGFHTTIRLSDIQQVPFYTINNMMREGVTIYVLNNIAGNILMFVPFGFLLPLIDSNMRKFYKTIPLGFFISLCIETWQLFLLRGTDVDDVILNTGGVIIGYFTFFIIKHLSPDFCKKFCMNRNRFNWLVAGTVLIPAVYIISYGFYHLH